MAAAEKQKDEQIEVKEEEKVNVSATGAETEAGPQELDGKKLIMLTW